MGCWESNPDWLNTRETPYTLCYGSSPSVYYFFPSLPIFTQWQRRYEWEQCEVWLTVLSWVRRFRRCGEVGLLRSWVSPEDYRSSWKGGKYAFPFVKVLRMSDETVRCQALSCRVWGGRGSVVFFFFSSLLWCQGSNPELRTDRKTNALPLSNNHILSFLNLCCDFYLCALIYLFWLYWEDIQFRDFFLLFSNLTKWGKRIPLDGAINSGLLLIVLYLPDYYFLRLTAIHFNVSPSLYKNVIRTFYHD